MEALVHEHKTFEKVSYTGKEAKSREFEYCTFKTCDFSNTDFSHSRFSDCTFIGCNLSMLKLHRAALHNVSFQECKLLGVNFSECDDFIFSVRFENCILDYASFMQKKMAKTQFIASSLKNVAFANATLDKAVFEKTDLGGAVFNGTQLKEADFTTAFNYDIDPELNNIRRAKFSLYGVSGLLTKHGIRIE